MPVTYIPKDPEAEHSRPEPEENQVEEADNSSEEEIEPVEVPYGFNTPFFYLSGCTFSPSLPLDATNETLYLPVHRWNQSDCYPYADGIIGIFLIVIMLHEDKPLRVSQHSSGTLKNKLLDLRKKLTSNSHKCKIKIHSSGI